MSAFDPLSWLKLIGGSTDARASSLTGDVSQRLKALVERTLQTTSPGLTGSKAGSLGQQIQYGIADNPPAGDKDGDLRQQVEALVVQLLESGSANALGANISGSLGQQIAAAAAGTSSKGAKTGAVGYFTLPTGPSAGTTVTTGAANTMGSWVDLSAAGLGSAFYITHLNVVFPTGGINYAQVELGTGATPTAIGKVHVNVSQSSTGGATVPFVPWIPVPASTRLQMRAACSGATQALSVVAQCVNQSDLAQAL